MKASALKIVAAGSILFLAALAWLDSRSNPPKPINNQGHQIAIPPRQETTEISSDRGEVGSATTSSASNPAKNSLSDAQQRLHRLLGPSLGTLDKSDLESARAYIQEMIRVSETELESFSNSPGDKNHIEFTTQEANLMRSAALWREVAECLNNHEYWLVSKYPSRIPNPPPGTHYQALTVAHGNNQHAAIVLIITDRGKPMSLASTSSYHELLNQQLLREATHSFNLRPDSERALLYREYRQARDSGKDIPKSSELHKIFPHGVWVDERTILMHLR
jgi:hypothetical protein